GIVDKRADIWAFGVVLYEMLTGEGLFLEGSVVDTLSAVMRKPVELEKLPAGTPPAIRRLLRRCLERNPKSRLHDIADARIVIDDLEHGVADEAPVAAAGPAQPPAPRWRERLAWGLVAAMALAIASLLLRGGGGAAPAARVIRSTLPMPPGVSIELDGERSGMPALSPDGRRIAFGAREGAGPTRIWVQELESGRAAPLPGTEEGYRPFWSPDGRSIGYFTWSHLATTPAAGGAISLLAPARDARGGTWNERGTIVFAPYPYGPLRSVAEHGGETRDATAPTSGSGRWTHRFPQFLPDGDHFLYLERTASTGSERAAEVRIGSLASPASSVSILGAQTNAVYARGQLLFVRDGALVAQPFDAGRLRLDGAPAALVSDLLVNDRFSYGVFSAAASGPAVFLTGKQRDLSQLVWRDRTGRRLGELGLPGNYSGFGGMALSRDGRWAAVGRISEGDTDADIWLYDLRRGKESRLALAGSDESDPIFSPDGRFLVYGTADEGVARVLRRDLATGDEVELFSQPDLVGALPKSISPDGRSVLVDLGHLDLTSDIALIPMEPGGEMRKIVATPRDEGFGQLSSDGRWLLWSSDESGSYEVYVARFPEIGGKVQISRAGGVQPRWNANDAEIYFKTPDNMLTTVTIDTGSGTISVGEPQPHFQVSEFVGWTYAVAADDQNILVREPLGERGASPITLLTDWWSLVGRP
ncbi:MAG: protein kinase, partial [Thermoanaerobaculia bacterium]